MGGIHLIEAVNCVGGSRGPALTDPVADTDTLVDFIAETTPGGGLRWTPLAGQVRGRIKIVDCPYRPQC